MKSLSWLTGQVLTSVGQLCGVPVDRDLKTIMARVEAEGDSFLTITLPTFCQAFERALDSGQVDYQLFTSFAKTARKGGLPRLFSGFLSHIFDSDGRLLDDVASVYIYAVRQVCLLHKKVLRPCTTERVQAAEVAFVETESKCAMYRDSPDRDIFRRVAAIVVSDLLKSCDYGMPGDLSPQHGPGVNTTRKVNNQKWVFDSWYERHEWFLPWHEYATGSYSAAIDSLMGVDSGVPCVKLVPPEDEPPVKVTFVPKTLKSPRVIAVESQPMQFAQQAVRKWLVGLIEQSEITGGRINFADQTVNQRLARASSASGRFATIDMKNASDLVTLEHVRDLFSVSPQTLEIMESVRSERAQLPSGVVIPLRKYASMGSAVCFPVEALAFYVASVAARIKAAGRAITSRSVREYGRDIYVYGDDILVPSHEAPTVCEYLESVNFQVNQHKSFWTGKFRESCGEDAYAGDRVTPVYCRRDCPANRRDAEGVVSWVSMANQFYMAGLWGAARAVRAVVETVVRRKLPHIRDGAPFVGWVSFSEGYSVQRWNRGLHRFEYRGMVPSARKVSDPLDGFAALRKCFDIIGSKAVDTEHLRVSVRRASLALKERWAPV